MRGLIEIMNNHDRSVTNLRRSFIVRSLQNAVPNILKAGILRSDLIGAFNILRAGHTLDGVIKVGPRSTTETVSVITYALNEISRRFDGYTNFLHIFRSVELSENEVKRFAEPHRVGIYWSMNENFTMGDDRTHAQMEGSVRPEAINWSETIPLNVDGVEEEIRLKPGAKIENFSMGGHGVLWDAKIASHQFA